MTSAFDLRCGPIVAIVNEGSGSCDASTGPLVQALFAAAGLTDSEVVTVEPASLSDALDAAIARAKVLVVLGGDGTIGTAATRCGAAGPPLIPLPGGTMNMLPKALYGTRNWQDALSATLAAPRLRNVSGGAVDEKRFYCAAILGAPSLWTEAREAVRDGDLLDAAKKAVVATRRSLSDPIGYDFGDISGTADAVSVICPLVSDVAEGDEPVLEAVALDPKTAADLFSLAFHTAYDGWRNDPSVTTTKTRKVVVTGGAAIPTILDGERVRVGCQALVSFLPVAFRALIPAHAST